MAGLQKYKEDDVGIVSGHAQFKGSGDENDNTDQIKSKANTSISKAYANATKTTTKPKKKKPAVKTPKNPVTKLPATKVPVSATKDPVTKAPATKAPKTKPTTTVYRNAIKGLVKKGKDMLGIKSPEKPAPKPKTTPLKPGQSFSPYRSEGNGSYNFEKGELVGNKGSKKVYDYSDKIKKSVIAAKKRTAQNVKNDNGLYGSSSYTPGTIKSRNPGYSSDSTTSGGKNDIPVGRYGDETGKQIPIPHSKAGTKEGDAMIASIKAQNKKNADQAEQNRRTRIMQDHYNKTGGHTGRGLHKKGSIAMSDPRTAAYRRQGAGKGINDYGSAQAPQARKPDPLANRRYGKKNINNEDYMKGGADYRKAQDTAKNKALKLPEAQYTNYINAIKGGASPHTAYGNAVKGIKAKPVVDEKKAAANRMLERDNKKYNG